MSSATHMEYGNAAKHNADQKPSFHALLSAVELYQLANASWVESPELVSVSQFLVASMKSWG